MELLLALIYTILGFGVFLVKITAMAVIYIYFVKAIFWALSKVSGFDCNFKISIN